jgi:hypothetical protein
VYILIPILSNHLGLVFDVTNATIELSSMQLCAVIVTQDDDVVEDLATFSLMLVPVVAEERVIIQSPATVVVEDEDSKQFTSM